MDYILDRNLVLYLPLHELDGASFMSKDAHGHLCTNYGATWTPQGRSFDGVDDKIVVPDLFTTAIDELSVIAWAKPETSLSARAIVSNLNGWWSTPEYGFHLTFLNSPSRLTVALGRGAGGMYESAMNYDFQYGHFYCVGFSFKKNSHLFEFVNEQKEYETTPTFSIDCSESRPVYLGVNGWNLGYNPYIGTIGEVIIYNRALTALEIQHIYLATKWRYR